MYGKEIERKFLVHTIPEGNHEVLGIEQYYVWHSPEIRLRRCNYDYIKTIKSGSGIEREEENTLISSSEFYDRQSEMIGRTVEKDLVLIPIHNNLTAEVSIYKNRLDGLKVVEVEFESMEQAQEFIPPEWFGEEVTGREEYRNFTLAVRT